MRVTDSISKYLNVLLWCRLRLCGHLSQNTFGMIELLVPFVVLPHVNSMSRKLSTLVYMRTVRTDT